jgi:hypothetical protein
MRHLPKTLLALSILLVLTACGGSKYAGVWYSDDKYAKSLTLTEDGTYSDGDWFTSGNYTVDGDTIVMTGPLDGSHTLTIEEEDGETVLRFSAGWTYYRSREKAEDKRVAKEAAEASASAAAASASAAAAEAERQAGIAALEKALVGLWVPEDYGGCYPLELTADGKITGKLSVAGAQAAYATYTYEVTEPDRVTVSDSAGGSTTVTASVADEGIYYDGNLYLPDKLIPLTQEALVGEWTEYDYILFADKYTFRDDGTYTSKRTGTAEENTTYTIVGDHELEIGGEHRWFFLRDLDEETYHLCGQGWVTTGAVRPK